MDRHYYYIKDNLGSTVAVVDQSGVAHQLTAYYPSGLPHDLTASEARTTDRLHIGNRWIDHKGMNSYDNTARMHYPVLPSFDTPDPLAEQFPQHSPSKPKGRFLVCKKSMLQMVLSKVVTHKKNVDFFCIRY